MKRRSLEDDLSTWGHEVTCCPDGQAALDRLQVAIFDVVIADLKMPGLDGMELLQKAKGGPNAGCDFIMITAYGSIPIAVEAMKNGAFDFITKPFSNERLLPILRRIEDVREASKQRESGDGREPEGSWDGILVGNSPAMRRVLEVVEICARTESNVLLCGETGTGKDLAASVMHKKSGRGRSQPRPISEVSGEAEDRVHLPITEFARVLGGGMVTGSIVLIGGDPGIGKSTLMLQMAMEMAGVQRVLYVSGEESERQIKMRAARLSNGKRDLPKNLLLVTETNLEVILNHVNESKPDLLIIDSIQTVYLSELDSSGSVSQVRECASHLRELAKSSGISVFLIGHVTKEGAIAGPRVLEHIVDTVLYFEGDTGSSFRLVRAFKNRFGAVNEIGVFAMTEKGLKGVSNPSAIFLSRHGEPVPGSCVLVTQEGTRPLLVEIQALVDSSHAPSPRRLSVGLEQNRLAMLLAVLHRHAGIACFDQDVFVNAVGGVKISEPAADLAVLAAIVSSLRSQPLPDKLVMFGEVGLAGEIRPVQRGQERLKEAAKLGFTQAIVPAANQPKQKIAGMEIHAVQRLDEAISLFREVIRRHRR